MENTQEITQEEAFEEIRASEEFRDLGLTTFEWRFVEAYAKCGNGTEAMIAAGSKAKRPAAVATNTLAKPRVQKAVQMLQQKRIEVMALDQTEVLQKLRDVYTGAMQDRKYSDANKAAELLGQALGMFNKGVNVKSDKRLKGGEGNVTEDTRDISELLQQVKTLTGLLDQPRH